MSAALITTFPISFFPSSPRLPLELVHLILDHLSPSHDKPTLASCTLVHTSWSTFARRLLFSRIHLDALTMPQRPHPDFSHINMPDFPGFLDFMRHNPILANSLEELDVTGFVRECWKEVPDQVDTGEGVDGTAVWGGTEMDVYDEFQWDWDWDLKQLRDVPSSCRWTKLPRAFLSALLAAPRLFPHLQALRLNSMFIEYGSEDEHLSTTKLPLKKLVLNEVGTTSNTTRAILQFLSMFDASHLTINAFPAFDALPTGPLPQRLATILGPTRTTSLEISGSPDASYMMEILRATPIYTKNITKLELHVRYACEVGALSNLLKSIGRNLKELSVDLKPSCYISKPEVHMEHDTYVALMRNFTLFPCTSLTSFTLHFSISFDYSGASNALDCTPHLLATLPPSVSVVTLVVNFPFVVQAAAINLNWNDVHFALVRMGSGRGGVRGGAGKGAGGGGGKGGVRRVRIVVENEGTRVGEEERINVRMLFGEKLYMIKDILEVEFSP